MLSMFYLKFKMLIFPYEFVFLCFVITFLIIYVKHFIVALLLKCTILVLQYYTNVAALPYS